MKSRILLYWKNQLWTSILLMLLANATIVTIGSKHKTMIRLWFPRFFRYINSFL